MKTSSLMSIVVACLSAGGAMAGYMLLRPTNLGKYLEWQGFKLASKDDEDLWKSIYEENKGIFKDSFLIANGVTEVDHWKTIRDYCTKAFKKTDYSSDISKSTKWCVDSVKTVRGQLVRNKSKVDDFMNELKQFKTATAVQGNEQFWGLIGVSSNNLEQRALAYQTWCENSLKSSPKDDLVKNVDNFCHQKPYSDFQSKLKNEGYRRITDSDIDKKYSEEVANLPDHTGSNLLEAIGGGSKTWVDELGVTKPWKVDETKFKEKYKDYCKKGDEMNLFDEGNYPNKYSEYRGICAVKEKP